MTARPRLALALALATVLAVAVGLARGGAPAGAAPARGYGCAFVPTAPAAPGETVSVSARLAGAVARYTARAPAPTTLPTPDYGLPYPGTLTIARSPGRTTLARPAGFTGAAVVQLCLVADGSRAPAVLLGAYTGGAHCCYVTALYAASPRGEYSLALDANLHSIRPPIAYDFNGGLAPKDVGGATVLESADGDFANYFGCYACTPTPLHLIELSGARLVDVSADHPTFIAANAAALWVAVRQNETAASGHVALFGALAAWVAEECEIGDGASAWSQVAVLARRGLLSDALYHRVAMVNKGSFVPALRSFLLAHGYGRGQLPAG